MTRDAAEGQNVEKYVGDTRQITIHWMSGVKDNKPRLVSEKKQGKCGPCIVTRSQVSCLVGTASRTLSSIDYLVIARSLREIRASF